MTGRLDPPLPPSVAIVSVGDELLFGETVDTNGSWLARECSLAGLRVTGRYVVGDVPESIGRIVLIALDQSDLVLVTGGLGPTPDDLTRETVAGLLGMTLEVDSGLLEGLRARFAARGFLELPEEARAMALVPAGGRVLRNSWGAAPGLAMEDPAGKLCVLLPGVPREMKGIFAEEVGPLLKGRYGPLLRPVAHKVVHTFGVPESILSSEIRDLMPTPPKGVSVAFLPDLLGVRLRLTTRETGGEGDGQARLERLEDLLEPVLGRYRYEAKAGDLAEAVGVALSRSGDSVAVAESCTGGLIAKRLTDQAGSSQYFLGGVVAYDNQVKVGLLGVDEELIREHGVVSEAVAKAMAAGVARILSASVGVGVTGIAGPGGGSTEKPVGTVFYSVFLDGESACRKELFLGDREAIRERAAHATLGLLLRLLEGRKT